MKAKKPRPRQVNLRAFELPRRRERRGKSSIEFNPGLEIAVEKDSSAPGRKSSAVFSSLRTLGLRGETFFLQNSRSR